MTGRYALLTVGRMATSKVTQRRNYLTMAPLGFSLMANIIAWILSLFVSVAPVCLTGEVSVIAAYVINTQSLTPSPQECCGQCVGGLVAHGDGHKTECPCPKDCKCKRAVTHPPAIIHSSDAKCANGKCKQAK